MKKKMIAVVDLLLLNVAIIASFYGITAMYPWEWVQFVLK